MTSVSDAKRREKRGDAVAARRVVLVGASNLTKSIGTVFETAASLWRGPLEVLGAWRHGRSAPSPRRAEGRVSAAPAAG